MVSFQVPGSSGGHRLAIRQVRSGRSRTGKGNGDASAIPGRHVRNARRSRDRRAYACVFSRGAYDYTRRVLTRARCVPSAPAPHIGSESNESLERTVPIAVRYRVAGLLNGDAHTACFQTLAGRRPHPESAHLHPFPARRTAASPLPSNGRRSSDPERTNTSD
jgi:hypothetical protein